jgi:hypothetical protein
MPDSLTLDPSGLDPLGRPLGLVQGDPTGFSSPLGQAVVGLALLSTLVLLIRWWVQNRRR